MMLTESDKVIRCPRRGTAYPASLESTAYAQCDSDARKEERKENGAGLLPPGRCQ
jgi:hypothetical protein